ncbi:bcl-2-like protein 10 [Sturnira hondurensis]|uniref:bcl-2-like protein 10 n=1 Tax=Sturnira hondurensis TaxID=192404 RepID=UPI001879D81D|nr:bcl-2-like protein 10 [Sturnira hondurensis]
MGDELKQRTAQLLADYLEYCARERGTAGRPPSTHEAALLRYLAGRIQQRHQSVFSRYQRFRGNRLQLVANAAQQLVRDSGFPTWGRVVLLLTLVGTLLERPPESPSWEQKEWEAEEDVDSDCRRLVAFLCHWLTVEHRAWLEAQGGWILNIMKQSISFSPSPLVGWLLSLLHNPNDLAHTAGPGLSLMPCSNNINLYLDTTTVSYQIFNPHLPA